MWQSDGTPRDQPNRTRENATPDKPRAQSEPHPLLRFGEQNIDMEYLLKYFSLAHRLELPAHWVKVFCKRPLLVRLWPKRKQEKAEIILFCRDPKDCFPARQFEEVVFESLGISLVWIQILKLNVKTSFLISAKVEEAIFAVGIICCLLNWCESDMVSSPGRALLLPALYAYIYTNFNQMQHAWGQNLPCSI